MNIVLRILQKKNTHAISDFNLVLSHYNHNRELYTREVIRGFETISRIFTLFSVVRITVPNKYIICYNNIVQLWIQY